MDDFNLTVPDDVDTVFEWRREEDFQPNKCRVRIYWMTWNTAIVIVSNITYYSGRQIINATDEIIRFITNIYDLVPNKMMFIEHYPASNSSQEDLYLQVLLTNKEAFRYEISRSQLLDLISKPI